MATTGLTYAQVLELIADYYKTDVPNITSTLAKYDVDVTNITETFKLLQNTPYAIWYNTDGTIRSYTNSSISKAITQTADTAGAIDSNIIAEVTNSANVSIPLNTVADSAGKVSITGGLKTAGNFVFKEVAPAIAATGVGITLGKTVDKLLYNMNPDFWDSKGMSSLNPDTWASITSGDDSFNSSLFNMIFKIDSEEQKTQGYIDENALAYIAMYMQSKGVFDEKTAYKSDLETAINQPINTINEFTCNESSYGDHVKYRVDNGNMALVKEKNNVYNILFAQRDKNGLVVSQKTWRTSWGESEPDEWNNIKWTSGGSTYLGMPISWSYAKGGVTDYDNVLEQLANTPNNASATIKDAYTIIYGTESSVSTVDGIDTQPNAVLPTLTTAATIADALAILKATYPDLWENAVVQDVIQSDGTALQYTYVPIGIPEAIDYADTQPVTGNATQGNTSVTPSTATQPLLDFVSKLISKIPTATDINTNTSTGSGNTPAIVPATGTASSLYAIYNPTLSQINALGAWLWSSDFIDQILKLFSDPMQAIIGLHKIFATPATGDEQNIKVGYLNSGVASKVVTDQYTTIDCGTVNCTEYFNNVFDYSPYTTIQIYLPFIGIVDLSTADVMRSRINVVYHVDVLSGACLAEVKITRDSAGGTLYQYAGNASVTMPISSGSYIGVMSNVVGVAARAVSGFAAGGPVGAAVGGVTGVLSAHGSTNVQHSGGFSGNAGAMGIKKPYLIIERPQTALADNFPNMLGYASNKYVTLSACSGFTKVKAVHVDKINIATDEEKTELEQLLMNGVIFE